MKKQFFLVISLLFLIIRLHGVIAYPLYTKSRWIVDGTGKRFKLACVNWPTHLQPLLAEGLSHQPLDVITKKIQTMGFNCVRLTYPTHLLTNKSYASVTVRQTFESLNLTEALVGLKAHNPSLLDLKHIDAYGAVVKSLGKNDVMAILDNHISVPGWCCNNMDGNGFFGDQYFDPDLWLEGLTRMAKKFKNTKNVIGMSLRNELRGPNETASGWFRYMPQGAEAVHKANPNVLVILSGLSFDEDLSFLRKKQVKLSFERKLVYEWHWYRFEDGDGWRTNNTNHICRNVMKRVNYRMLFLLKQQRYPLFFSEFGINQSNITRDQEGYLSCLLGIVTELDLDFAVWGLQGDYYYKQGQKGMDETYGVLNKDWSAIRNQHFLNKLSFIQAPFRGPDISKTAPYNIVYHPSTGLCIAKDPLRLGHCNVAWTYTPQKTIKLEGSNKCLQAVELGKSPVLGNACSGPSSQWEMISDSKMHLTSKLSDGTTVCLDTAHKGEIVINKCKCLYGDPNCDPTSQWFKFVISARDLPK